MTEFFKVIREGLIECGHCESSVPAYSIVFQDDVAGECGTGTEYSREEDAEEVCKGLNWAFNKGAESKGGQS